MATTLKTANVKIAAPGAEGIPGDDKITLVNDINIGVQACTHNGWLGTRGVGYVLPGQTVQLPSGGALWDVFLLRETGAGVFLDLFTGTITYDAMKSNVNSLAHLKVSEFY